MIEFDSMKQFVEKSTKENKIDDEDLNERWLMLDVEILIRFDSTVIQCFPKLNVIKFGEEFPGNSNDIELILMNEDS